MYYCNVSWVMVALFNTPSFFIDIQYKLSGVPGLGYGLMTVSHKHQWGEICSTGWEDKEASVFCRSLSASYIGGVAVYYQSTPDVPMLLSDVSCVGNETKMIECNTDEKVPCFITLRAGSICYKESGLFQFCLVRQFTRFINNLEKKLARDFFHARLN